MIVRLRNADFDWPLRCLARALLWTLAGGGAAALALLTLLAWSRILVW